MNEKILLLPERVTWQRLGLVAALTLLSPPQTERWGVSVREAPFRGVHKEPAAGLHFGFTSRHSGSNPRGPKAEFFTFGVAKPRGLQ